jgi:hypothetical protein
MSTETDTQHSNRGFRLIMKWSGLFFVILVIVGLIYRTLYPVKLQLDQDQYIKRVFTGDESKVYPTLDTVDVFYREIEAGEILYVIQEQDSLYLVRPLITMNPDSVWISQTSVIDYTPQSYKQWQMEKDQKTYGME